MSGRNERSQTKAIEDDGNPLKPWQVVSVDRGPYYNGHYNLVIIDKWTRCPKVKMVYSTAMKSTKEKIRKCLLHIGHLNNWKATTDHPSVRKNKEFVDFALEEGFKHHGITPLHPRANVEAENFMKLLNKKEQRTELENKFAKIAIQQFLWHLLVAGCDIGISFSVHPSVKHLPSNLA